MSPDAIKHCSRYISLLLFSSVEKSNISSRCPACTSVWSVVHTSGRMRPTVHVLSLLRLVSIVPAMNYPLNPPYGSQTPENPESRRTAPSFDPDERYPSAAGNAMPPSVYPHRRSPHPGDWRPEMNPTFYPLSLPTVHPGYDDHPSEHYDPIPGGSGAQIQAFFEPNDHMPHSSRLATIYSAAEVAPSPSINTHRSSAQIESERKAKKKLTDAWKRLMGVLIRRYPKTPRTQADVLTFTADIFEELHAELCTARRESRALRDRLGLP
ncbi:hypothetical protein SISNIDRAFT_482944 [Sistotremastrum niveocremeum HHB9708]|uniref:Uncharacterized protein n=1 Tax=Sistotremastrum niveocremeum HHB9708 TaxID=1314777 RepID=A0A164XWT6_9AGAM|nr:hypothetical protein SISNIDRAFT_482944 [Sistotremastrum niveocremeum HHB9708]